MLGDNALYAYPLADLDGWLPPRYPYVSPMTSTYRNASLEASILMEDNTAYVRDPRIAITRAADSIWYIKKGDRDTKHLIHPYGKKA